MYSLLRLLEQRAGGGSVSAMAWILVLALGLAMAIASWADTWIAWIAYADLGLHLRSELSALIFAKATRRKDAKGSRRPETADGMNDGALAEGEQDDVPIMPTTEKISSTMINDLEETRQSTINLVVRIATSFSSAAVLILQHRVLMLGGSRIFFDSITFSSWWVQKWSSVLFSSACYSAGNLC